MMDINSFLSAHTHAQNAKVQMAAARLVSGTPGTEKAFATLARAAQTEQANFAKAAQAIASPAGGIDIRV